MSEGKLPERREQQPRSTLHCLCVDQFGTSAGV
jgi:hypothetical protein